MDLPINNQQWLICHKTKTNLKCMHRRKQIMHSFIQRFAEMINYFIRSLVTYLKTVKRSQDDYLLIPIGV